MNPHIWSAGIDCMFLNVYDLTKLYKVKYDNNQGAGKKQTTEVNYVLTIIKVSPGNPYE
jgi:hypothetical protein